MWESSRIRSCEHQELFAIYRKIKYKTWAAYTIALYHNWKSSFSQYQIITVLIFKRKGEKDRYCYVHQFEYSYLVKLQNSSKNRWALGAYNMKIDHLTTCQHNWNSRSPVILCNTAIQACRRRYDLVYLYRNSTLFTEKTIQNELSFKLDQGHSQGMGRKERTILFLIVNVKGNLLTIQ